MPEQPIFNPTETAEPIVSRRGVLGFAVATVGAGLFLEACSSPDSTSAPVEPTNSPDTSTGVEQYGDHDPANSDDEQLQQLAKHEKELGRKFDELMVFLPMPTDEASAAERATETAGKLKAFAESGVKPYLVIEPNDPNQEKLDLHKLPVGAFASFLKGLRDEGITGEQMGTVVVCPEANMPNWKDGETDPELFKHNVTRLGAQLKDVFPDAKLGILLNSTSYASNDWGSADNSTAAFLKYTEGLKGVDELCYQGSPWSNDSTNPTHFLKVQTAITAAERLGGPEKVKLRFNTGTYATQINPDTKENVPMSVGDRITILEGIFQQVQIAKHAGYDPVLQIFAENKSQAEADWSYDRSAADTAALKDTLNEANKAGIHTTIYG